MPPIPTEITNTITPIFIHFSRPVPNHSGNFIVECRWKTKFGAQKLNIYVLVQLYFTCFRKTRAVLLNYHNKIKNTPKTTVNSLFIEFDDYFYRIYVRWIDPLTFFMNSKIKS